VSEYDRKASIKRRPWAVASREIIIYAREYTTRKGLTPTEGENSYDVA
jgi:hypothetical protein